MRAVVQRVSRAQVRPGGEIGRGLCVLLGVARRDGEEQAARLAGKVARLRIFPDEHGRFDQQCVTGAGMRANWQAAASQSNPAQWTPILLWGRRLAALC